MGYEDVFSVMIDKNETVEDLKEAIKEVQKSFQNVHFRTLGLHRVSLPMDDELSNTLKNLQISDLPPLRMGRKLSDVFSGVVEGNLHIIVEPPLKLWCITHTDSMGYENVFSVMIDKNKTVEDLKKAIKNEEPDCKDVISSRIYLWHVSIPVDDDFEESCRNANLGGKKPLMPLMKLFEIFPSVPPRENLHVMIKVGTTGKSD
ncbi:hypothetical protein AX17_007218 [Amanita inopinata Kibby_2008]|nr:hypothetical protein AX17_007218 [Amanita inopinata Kibby_2008]